MDFAISADHRVKMKESEKRDKYLDFARELKKLCNMKVIVIPTIQSPGIGGYGNKRMSGDHSNYSIVEIGQNTKKSPEDSRRLAVTQTPVENHQLTLVWKTLKWVKQL